MQSSHYETLYHQEQSHWWYRVRRELVHDIIKKYVAPKERLHIADIGCGAGALTKELEQYGSCVGIDMSQQAIDFCRARGISELNLGSAEHTGLADNSVDVAICLDVLEHLTDDMVGILEIQRILKPDGIAIIFIPAFMFLWSVTDEVSHHHRRYRMGEIIQKFKEAHFTIEKSSYFNTILFPLIAAVRIIVRILHIPMKSEAETGDGIINTMLYRVFSCERTLLQHVNFAAGVSIMIIAKKTSEKNSFAIREI